MQNPKRNRRTTTATTPNQCQIQTKNALIRCTHALLVVHLYANHGRTQRETTANNRRHRPKAKKKAIDSRKKTRESKEYSVDNAILRSFITSDNITISHYHTKIKQPKNRRKQGVTAEKIHKIYRL